MVLQKYKDYINIVMFKKIKERRTKNELNPNCCSLCTELLYLPFIIFSEKNQKLRAEISNLAT